MGSSSLGKWNGKWIKDSFPEAYRDLCTSFIDRGFTLSSDQGYSAMVTMQSWMFLGSYEKLRGKLLRNHTISSMAHLGTRAFGAIGGEVVSTTATVFANKKYDAPGTYLRLVDMGSEQEKAAGALEALANPACGWRYRCCSQSYESIPGTPIAYWVSKATFASFKKYPALKTVARPTAGIRTGDNERFLRLLWEVDRGKCAFTCTSRDEAKNTGAKWFPCHKGGGYRKWYGNCEYLINWENDGAELSNFSGCDNAGVKFFFRPGISWGTISSANLSLRYSFPGMISEHCGSMCFTENHIDIVCCMALLNSSVSDSIHSLLSPGLSFREAAIGNTPLCFGGMEAKISSLSDECVTLSKADWDAYETAWDFKKHPLI